jgi:hypothetical protein
MEGVQGSEPTWQWVEGRESGLVEDPTSAGPVARVRPQKACWAERHPRTPPTGPPVIPESSKVCVIGHHECQRRELKSLLELCLSSLPQLMKFACRILDPPIEPRWAVPSAGASGGKGWRRRALPSV